MGFLSTAESVANGHPDKIADQISDAILDAYLAVDPHVSTAIDACLAADTLVLGGTVATTDGAAHVDHGAVARDVLKNLGYGDPRLGFPAERIQILDRISRGNGTARGPDQGIAIGYACRETPALMPLPIQCANELVRGLASLRRTGALPYLRPDGRVLVTVEYDGSCRPRRIHSVVVSCQHEEGVSLEKVRSDVRDALVVATLPPALVDAHTRILVNPAGPFVAGGPAASSGLTGRTLAADTYGGRAPHGGRALSGRDPLRVARAATYMARYVAKSVVLAEIADACEVALVYGPGSVEPRSVRIHSAGLHSSVSDDVIERAVAAVFPSTIDGIAHRLDLLQPIFEDASFGGHFGREEPGFSWERTDQVEALWDAVGRCRRSPAPLATVLDGDDDA